MASGNGNPTTRAARGGNHVGMRATGTNHTDASGVSSRIAVDPKAERAVGLIEGAINRVESVTSRVNAIHGVAEKNLTRLLSMPVSDETGGDPDVPSGEAHALHSCLSRLERAVDALDTTVRHLADL